MNIYANFKFSFYWIYYFFYSKVDELNEQHLHYLLMKHKVYLQDIFSGKVLVDIYFDFRDSQLTSLKCSGINCN